MTVITLQERRATWMTEKRKHLASALGELSAYAREHQGKFYLFGSALDDRFSLNSDVDIISDFGSVQADWQAWNAAAEILRKYDLAIDGLPMTGCSEDFLSFIEDEWREL